MTHTRTTARPGHDSRPGSWLRDARIAAGMTQAELAVALGVKQPSISRWERSNALPRMVVLSVAEALTHRD